MSIIDFRSQILPEIKGGCKDYRTSIKMLEEMKAQEIEYVVASPCYNALEMTIPDFLKSRKYAFEQISGRLKPGYPIIKLGAEVEFFEGISKTTGIEKLCIEHSRILLINMPKKEWKKSYIDELLELKKRGFNVVLVNFEQDIKNKKNRQFLSQIKKAHFTVQVDANSIISWKSRRFLLKMINKNLVHILGTNCQDMKCKKPNLLKAREIINTKLGDDTIDGIDTFSPTFFNDVLEG